MTKTIKRIIMFALIAVIFISGCFALNIQKGYANSESANKELAPYRPVIAVIEEPAEEASAEPAAVHVNQGILDMQAQYPDAVGWIRIPFTAIDYPFVQAENNKYYLDKDMDGKYSVAGTVFMEYRSSRDFSDFNTILYGHHMKDGTMFASLSQFEDKDFFNTNKTGMIMLDDKTYLIEIFAYMVVRDDDVAVYESPTNTEEKQYSLDYIKENARQYRDIKVSPEDKIVTLSSCTYEFKNSRMILLGKLVLLQGIEK